MTLTLKELSRLYWLNREVEMKQQQLDELMRERQMDQARLWELRQSMDTGMIASPIWSDMPKSPSLAASRVESVVIQALALEENLNRKCERIRDLETCITQRQTACLEERARLEKYIEEIDDPYLRMVFTLRFINGLQWEQVAASIGGGNKAESVKKACYRRINGCK